MIYQTAWVLHHIKYSENDIILHAITPEGKQAFFIKNFIHKKQKRNFLFPLSLVELKITEKSQSLIRCYQVSPLQDYAALHRHPVQSSMLVFLAELLYKSLDDDNPQKELFPFVQERMEVLSNQNISSNFHLNFIRDLCVLFGFQPNMKDEEQSFFDFLGGQFVEHANDFTKKTEDIQAFQQLFSHEELHLSNEMRKQLLEDLLLYYKLHVNPSMNIKSLEVFRALFH